MTCFYVYKGLFYAGVLLFIVIFVLLDGLFEKFRRTVQVADVVCLHQYYTISSDLDFDAKNGGLLISLVLHGGHIGLSGVRGCLDRFRITAERNLLHSLLPNLRPCQIHHENALP